MAQIIDGKAVSAWRPVSAMLFRVELPLLLNTPTISGVQKKTAVYAKTENIIAVLSASRSTYLIAEMSLRPWYRHISGCMPLAMPAYIAENTIAALAMTPYAAIPVLPDMR